ncbi:peptidase S46 family protein [Parabacteroides distasonis str. 3776 D15 iv]|uniref:Dipeptidyl-peptidase n=2 Tax=Parabacteroides distasonis TaxID=823 RepID=A0AB34L7D2_PARDI|nr:S46 family peptidase [Parabacteroides distasonis]KDS36600.1 peptidase S46 family protein [Parabacteroides distasonis str. 3776 D15 i]KDS49046.1 peptidase S46 family protein [Parabacteroides distasonis str. 3776 Po2 i]KDS69131.1 peptidase S46 family protein [Parabacteroides distasonis str. 3776 D15 iv]
MKLMKRVWAALLLLAASGQLYADEGMWVLKELNKQNLARMAELGFTPSYDQLYSETDPCVANAVVIFGGGCTGITVSDEGLIFTNHHCGFGSIQQLSSVEHDYLKDGFVSQSKQEELPVPGLSVRYLKETVDVSDRINSQIAGIEDEFQRLSAADSIGRVICDSVGNSEFQAADVVPFYNNNKYFLVVYDVFRDVRMVFAPPSSIGKFGGDTDNWMWPRHTGDFSVFRVYANADNKPSQYDQGNKPYSPKYVAEVSMQGYQDKDYAMTIGFPGSTDRYLCSWGVQQRIENSNKPRIEVRGIKQGIWKEAMSASDAVRIKYASKYAGSSNYWKNSIGMNKGLANLNVIERKRAEETAFADWVAKDQVRGAKYGEVLNLLEKGYTSTNKYREALTYLNEAFSSGAEIIRLARMVQSVDINGATPEEITVFLEDRIQPFFKDYEPSLDQKVLAAMMKIAKERVSSEFLPDIYTSIDKKYKGNYEKYAADVFKKTSLLSYDKIAEMLRNPKQYEKLRKDPAAELSLSVLVSIFQLQQLMGDAEYDIAKGERLYFAGLKEMYPEKALSSDANFTMRLSYGSIGGYRPYDAAWYNYYSTDKGILEKEDPTSDEFWVQPEILDLVRSRDFGPYANEKGELQLCFLSNNDITGGNSGSPVFDKNARLIGLAFDGNWEAMSGDIAFEPDLQRCIGVDIRYVLFMIDKWGKCPRLIEELKLVR